jgi:ABC-type multidrug transport system fused ATPase/permease subunit
MHTLLLAAVLRLPMTFFDVTPLGRILNRFAKDIDVCDNVLPHVLRMFIAMTFSVSSPCLRMMKLRRGDLNELGKVF